MDDDSSGRRPGEPPIPPASSANYAGGFRQDPASRARQSFAVPSILDRYRTPAALDTSSAVSVSRGMAATTAYSSYFPQDPGPAGQASSFPAEMGYQSSAAAYGQPDTAARQPSQGYAGYPTSMMYNVPQSATGSSQSASGFESSVTSQFGTPRHHHQPQSAAAMQMLSTGMASPYFAADSSSTSAAVATSTLPNQAALYQQNDPGIAGFATGDMGGMPGLADAAETRGSASISRPAQEFGSEPLSGDGLGKNYAEYKAMLREVFSDIKATRLVTAADTLIKLSERLLTKVDELGLTADDPQRYAGRMKLWDDFNHAWLALFQRQKTAVEEGQQLHQSQSLLSSMTMKRMAKELTRLCDGIERHGLVDYQYGVWEEQISRIIIATLDVTEPLEEATSGRQGSSSSKAGGGGSRG